MADLRDLIEQYIKRVKELQDDVKGNEQATKQSLIGPFFTMLGYDLTDPRECKPEYKVDFGKDRSSKPIDWAFVNNGNCAFFVEAKEVGKKLAAYDEQLADYFAKDPHVKLGILTNGAHWRFFTDGENSNVMDKEPFAKWDVVVDEAPHDVIKLIAKAGFNAENIRTYAKRRREQNLLVGELTALLEPAPSFTKLAIEKIETRNLTQAVVESWTPIVASALSEWARQRMLTAALAAPAATTVTDSRSGAKKRKGRITSHLAGDGDDDEDDQPDENDRIETDREDLTAFASVRNLLGPNRAIAYEDSVAYFKIHLAEKRTWVFARLQLDRRHPAVWVPLPPEKAKEKAGGRPVTVNAGWAVVALEAASEIAALGGLFEAAYSHVKQDRTATDD